MFWERPLCFYQETNVSFFRTALSYRRSRLESTHTAWNTIFKERTDTRNSNKKPLGRLHLEWYPWTPVGQSHSTDQRLRVLQTPSGQGEGFSISDNKILIFFILIEPIFCTQSSCPNLWSLWNLVKEEKRNVASPFTGSSFLLRSVPTIRGSKLLLNTCKAPSAPNAVQPLPAITWGHFQPHHFSSDFRFHYLISVLVCYCLVSCVDPGLLHWFTLSHSVTSFGLLTKNASLTIINTWDLNKWSCFQIFIQVLSARNHLLFQMITHNRQMITTQWWHFYSTSTSSTSLFV